MADVIPRSAFVVGRTVSFDEYYAQFDRDGVLSNTLRHSLRSAIAASKDPVNFSDIPLARWDMLPHPESVGRLISQANGGKPGFITTSLSDWVCAYKVAARKLRQEQK